MKNLFRFGLSALAFINVFLPKAGWAGDSQTLVCAGQASLGFNEAAHLVPVSITYFDSRATDGISRLITVSAVYQNRLFQGTYLNRSTDANPVHAAIQLKNAITPGKVLMKGKYTLQQDVRDGSYSLKLDGLMTADPSAAAVNYESATASLACSDISI